MNDPIIQFPAAMLPHARGLLLEDVFSDNQTRCIFLRTTAPTAFCPLCHQPTTCIHSRFTRHPADLRWAGQAVRFVLHGGARWDAGHAACGIGRSAHAAHGGDAPATGPERCSDEERAVIAQLRACHPDITTTMAFTERFTTTARERQGDALLQWFADAQASGIREFGQFALNVRQDEMAVRPGCSLAWSNGQTKGHVTHLPLLKRQMYGRTKFDRLRHRAPAA
jgi:hypothetical protein